MAGVDESPATLLRHRTSFSAQAELEAASTTALHLPPPTVQKHASSSLARASSTGSLLSQPARSPASGTDGVIALPASPAAPPSALSSVLANLGGPPAASTRPGTSAGTKGAGARWAGGGSPGMAGGDGISASGRSSLSRAASSPQLLYDGVDTPSGHAAATLHPGLPHSASASSLPAVPIARPDNGSEAGAVPDVRPTVRSHGASWKSLLPTVAAANAFAAAAAAAAGSQSARGSPTIGSGGMAHSASAAALLSPGLHRAASHSSGLAVFSAREALRQAVGASAGAPAAGAGDEADGDPGYATSARELDSVMEGGGLGSSATSLGGAGEEAVAAWLTVDTATASGGGDGLASGRERAVTLSSPPPARSVAAARAAIPSAPTKPATETLAMGSPVRRDSGRDGADHDVDWEKEAEKRVNLNMVVREVKAAILSATITVPMPDLSEGVQSLLSGMLSADPTTRFTMVHVTAHPWMTTPPPVRRMSPLRRGASGRDVGASAATSSPVLQSRDLASATTPPQVAQAGTAAPASARSAGAGRGRVGSGVGQSAAAAAAPVAGSSGSGGSSATARAPFGKTILSPLSAAPAAVASSSSSPGNGTPAYVAGGAAVTARTASSDGAGVLGTAPSPHLRAVVTPSGYDSPTLDGEDGDGYGSGPLAASPDPAGSAPATSPTRLRVPSISLVPAAGGAATAVRTARARTRSDMSALMSLPSGAASPLPAGSSTPQMGSTSRSSLALPATTLLALAGVPGGSRASLPTTSLLSPLPTHVGGSAVTSRSARTFSEANALGVSASVSHASVLAVDSLSPSSASIGTTPTVGSMAVAGVTYGAYGVGASCPIAVTASPPQMDHVPVSGAPPPTLLSPSTVAGGGGVGGSGGWGPTPHRPPSLPSASITSASAPIKKG